MMHAFASVAGIVFAAITFAGNWAATELTLPARRRGAGCTCAWCQAVMCGGGDS